MMRLRRTQPDSSPLMWTRETIAIKCAMLAAECRGPGPNSASKAVLTLMLTKFLSAGMSCFSASVQIWVFVYMCEMEEGSFHGLPRSAFLLALIVWISHGIAVIKYAANRSQAVISQPNTSARYFLSARSTPAKCEPCRIPRRCQHEKMPKISIEARKLWTMKVMGLSPPVNCKGFDNGVRLKSLEVLGLLHLCTSSLCPSTRLSMLAYTTGGPPRRFSSMAA